jgi:hypothetical protein
MSDVAMYVEMYVAPHPNIQHHIITSTHREVATSRSLATTTVAVGGNPNVQKENA